jgi:uncharacterized Tic20 family protein
METPEPAPLPPPPPAIVDAPPVQEMSYSGQPQSSSAATTAMIVGIAGLFLFGIVLGPLAIFLGGKAEREIAESGGRLTGAKRAKRARVIGVIALVLWVVILVVNLSVRS